MSFYGIDLGTSQCLVARAMENLDEQFEVTCIPDTNGYKSFPSVVSFPNSGEYIVGDAASERLISAPDSTVELVKIRLGKTQSIPLLISGESVLKTPQEITSLLLRHMKEAYRDKFSSPVLTVPAFFDQSQKNALKEAGQLAGIEFKSLIEEPTAAVVYQIFSDYQKYGSDFFAKNKNKNVLVFDFGGGTLDLSLIRLGYEDGAVNPEVLAIGGDENLGGNLIDFIFTETVLEILSSQYPNDNFLKEVVDAFSAYFLQYREQHVLNFDADVSSQVKHFIFRLKRELERVKISLSSNECVNITFESKYKELPITRSQFDLYVLNRDNLNIRDRIWNALAEIAQYGHVVNEVLLVGGSSQIPYVKQIILESFNNMGISEKAIFFSDDNMQAVAKGAAIQAALLAGEEIPPFKNNKCTSVVGRDIILDCGSSTTLFVKKGTPYPFSESKNISIRIPHALSTTVQLRLSEDIGSSKIGISKKTICDYPYYLPLYYTGDEMIISLNIDNAGLYMVDAVHVPTKEKVHFEPIKAYAISSNDFQDVFEKLAALKENSDAKLDVETPTISLPSKSPQKIAQKENVIDLIKSAGIKYVDNREKNGCLWIIGGNELSEFVAECGKKGIKFFYKYDGSKASSGKPCWWTK